MKAFIQFFDEHLKRLPQTYEWPVRPKTKAGLPDFQWHPISGTMAECIAMKHHLTNTWASANAAQKAQLARWIVSDWGGVRTNADATIAAYLTDIANGNFQTPLQGIASYSKILSVVDCNRYAIYDARVAAGLNAVQLLMSSENPLFFHYIQGRNSIIQGTKKKLGFVDVFTKSELVKKRGWQEVKKEASYGTYLELLRGLKSTFSDHEIYHFEMTLFSMAPELCTKAMHNEQVQVAFTGENNR